VLNDADFLEEVLQGLPGVDTSDQRFENLLKKDSDKKPEDEEKDGSA
jgi:hypothetical protein